MASVEARIEKDMDPMASARQMDTDERRAIEVYLSKVKTTMETGMQQS